MTLCGVQEFSAGGAIVWGVELEDDQRHLFPPGKRLIRSRSHIFSTAIVPTVADAFDCEHVLQLEIGKFPEWLARPVLAEAGKASFGLRKNSLTIQRRKRFPIFLNAIERFY